MAGAQELWVTHAHDPDRLRAAMDNAHKTDKKELVVIYLHATDTGGGDAELRTWMRRALYSCVRSRHVDKQRKQQQRQTR
jgi:hypothetical protein